MRTLAATLVLAVAAGAAGGRYEAVLAARGVEPDAADLGRFLRSLRPGERVRDRALALVEWLGGADSTQRTQALRRLLEQPAAAAVALKRISRSEDPEIRRSVGPLLNALRSRLPDEALEAALHVIALRGITDLTGEVLDTVPICHNEALRRSAERALRVTARPADAPLLRAALDSADPDQAGISLRLYAASFDETAARERLSHPEPRVRLAAALALADLGRRGALPTLVDLLGAGDPSVRSRAAHALRVVSGRTFDYDAYDPPARRTHAKREWEAWAASRTLEARWPRPLPLAPVELGRTLVSLQRERKVLELGPDQRTRWERGTGGQAFACAGLPNGHRLVACYTHPRAILEFDTAGTERWRSPDLGGGITSVVPLENGNLLVTIGFRSRVFELKPPDEIVWEKPIGNRPCDARPVPGGRLLVALHAEGRVVEADRNGRVLAELAGLKGPFSAQRLANGNTLVCEQIGRRVAEYTPEGERVWERADLERCYHAERLANGRTLIGCWNGVLLIHPDGTERWLRKGADYHWPDRY